MDPLRWQQLERLFEQAIRLPKRERPAFLDAFLARDGDPELRRELEEMLDNDEEEGAVDGHEPGSGVARAIESGLQLWAAREGPPRRLGPYRLGREIGRGGMATVYEAERDDREFHLKVAVKVLRRGMDSDDIVRRLRRERQILANLDHPHIARLLDGGTTEDGRPYVVMEHIDGERIDLYCSRHHLPLEARLRLFRQICDAVHFAHRNLVLHRDIKPSNILVTGDGVPKLLDFGIAKVLAGGDEAEASHELTLTGLRLLTPEWASPEQVRGESLTTASDVYSLGLLLYLLVAGRRAYEVDAKRPAELERIVCEVVPPPPGRKTRYQLWPWAKGVAPDTPPAGNSPSPVAGNGGAPGNDLDVVVLTALHKDPARRYASAEQLGEDVFRVLENLPIQARRDSFRYRTRIFIRRHRLAVSLALLTFVALLTTALVAVGQARMAREQSRRAEENLHKAEAQRQRAEQVASVLVDLLKVSDPTEARGRSLTAREVLDQGAQRVRFSLKGDPELRAELLGTIGRVYQSLALYDEASSLLEEAARLHRELAPTGPATAESLRNLAQLLIDRGQYERAESLAREALVLLEAAPEAPPLTIAKSLQQLADLEVTFDRFEEAERLYQKALAIRQQWLGNDAEEVSLTRNSLGELRYQRGAYAEAKEIFEGVLATRRRVLGSDHPEIATSLNNLAAAELALRQLPEAEAHQREVLAIRRRIYGENHNEVALALHNLATTEAERQDLPSAIANMEQALAINRRVLGPQHPRVADNLRSLGMFQHTLGRDDRAAALYGEALELRRQIYGSRHPSVAQSLRSLAELLMEREPTRATAYFREALEIDRQVLPPNDYRLASSLVGLGRLALGRSALAEAEARFREARGILQISLPNDWRRAEVEGWLGHTLALRRPGQAEAITLLEASAAELEQRLGPDNPRVKTIFSFLAQARAAARS